MGRYVWKDRKDIPEGMLKQNPPEYFELHERFCPYCRNAETSIRNMMNISKEFNKGYVQKVLNVIREKNLSNFKASDVIEALQARDISDGTLQRKALAILSVLGYIRKERVEYKNKKGETKFKNIYNLTPTFSPCLCYNSSKDRHQLDWNRDAVETNYFWNKLEVTNE